MKKRILIGIFVLLLSISLVSAGLLTGAWGKYIGSGEKNYVLDFTNWLSGKAIYSGPVYHFYNTEFYPLPVPTSFRVVDIWTYKEPSSYNPGEQGILYVNVVDAKGMPLSTNKIINYGVISDLTESVQNTRMDFIQDIGLYMARFTVPNYKNSNSLKVMVSIVNGEKYAVGTDFVNFAGNFKAFKATECSLGEKGPIGATCYSYVRIGESDYFNNRTITLQNVGSDGTISISVDGIMDTINMYSVKFVNGLYIQPTGYEASDKFNNAAAYMVATCNFESIPSFNTCNIIPPLFTVPNYKISMEKIEPQMVPVTDVAYLFIKPENSIEKSQQITLKIGDSVTITNKLVKLENIGGTGAILVDVDGFIDTIGVSNSKTINGVEIENVMAYYAFESGLISNVTPIILNKSTRLVPPTEESICPLPAEYSKVGYSQLWRRLDVGTCNFFDANICLEAIDNEIALLKVDRWEDKIKNGEKRRIGNIGMIVYLPKNETKPWKYITLTTWPCFGQSNNNLTSSPGFEKRYENISQNNLNITPENISLVNPSCNGCLLDGRCLPYNTRIKDSYCSIYGEIQLQNELGESCEDSYQCLSNDCKDGQCVSTVGLLQKILDYLGKLF